MHWSKDVRFDKIAEGFGCHGEYVEKEDDIGPAIERAYASGKAAVIHVPIDPKANSEEMPNYDDSGPGTPKARSRPEEMERTMREYLKFYIDGQWVDPVEPKTLDVDNPATEQVSGKIALGSAADVDKAVKAARKAFATWSQTSREERLDLLQAILAEYQKRAGDLGAAVTEEMGAPPSLAGGSRSASASAT